MLVLKKEPLREKMKELKLVGSMVIQMGQWWEILLALEMVNKMEQWLGLLLDL